MPAIPNALLLPGQLALAELVEGKWPFAGGMFVCQAKLGRRCPSYLAEWLAGIRAARLARRPERVGVLVWKPLAYNPDIPIHAPHDDYMRLLELR